MADINAAVRWLVAWNDERRVPTDIRILKIQEEAGEAAQAYIGWLGANPRKGITCEVDDVHTELADVALAALVALATLHADPVATLEQRAQFVTDRLKACP